MFRLFLSALILSVLVFFSSQSFAQDANDFHVLHIQTFKMTGMPMGDDGPAFNNMVKSQAKVINSDSRVLRSYVLRHYWGADSRDLVIVTEFKNYDDLFSFYEDMDSLMDNAFSEEEQKANNAIWNKYVGQHSDEIYRVVSDTRK